MWLFSFPNYSRLIFSYMYEYEPVKNVISCLVNSEFWFQIFSSKGADEQRALYIVHALILIFIRVLYLYLVGEKRNMWSIKENPRRGISKFPVSYCLLKHFLYFTKKSIKFDFYSEILFTRFVNTLKDSWEIVLIRLSK